MWQKYKLVIVFGSILVLAVIGGIIENSISSPLSTSPTPENSVAALPQPKPVPTTPSQIKVENGIVIASGSEYKVLPITSLTNPGSVAVEGVITQVIPDAITKSNTPYYFVIQNDGSVAVIGVIVPPAQIQNFDVNIFPIGTKILVAGDIFPFGGSIFNYSALIQATDVPVALQQLNLPSNTPFVEANFQNIERSN